MPTVMERAVTTPMARKTQGQLLAECFELLVESKTCPETTPREWISRLIYLHQKGWLFASAGPEGRVEAVAAGYRVPDLTQADVMPSAEQGQILYVPFYASRSGRRLGALRMLRAYLQGCRAPIREVAFYRLTSEMPRRYQVRGGVIDEQV